jgi:hypothetical protein
MNMTIQKDASRANAWATMLVSLYNRSYNMTQTKTISHGPLLEHASGVPTSWALVFIPLSVAPKILPES